MKTFTRKKSVIKKDILVLYVYAIIIIVINNETENDEFCVQIEKCEQKNGVMQFNVLL